MSEGFPKPVDPPWCDDCYGPIFHKTIRERVLSAVCWFLVMHWPYRFFMCRAHAAVLPWAGTYAYTCTCRKGRAALAKSRGERP